MILEIPAFTMKSLRTDEGLWLSANSVSDFMLECALANSTHKDVFIYLARTFAGNQPHSNAKPECKPECKEADGSGNPPQVVGGVVPEAGIEPATKGL